MRTKKEKSTEKHKYTPKSPLVHLLVPSSLLASLAGWAAFIILIIPDFNIYWLIVSPIIIAFYQAPAVYIYWLWKKKTNRLIELESNNNKETSD
jgi:hypothetical protein